MRQVSVIASVLVSHLRHAGGALAAFLNPFRDVRKYRPEQHYMRGPGPKWREKTLASMHRPRAAPELVKHLAVHAAAQPARRKAR